MGRRRCRRWSSDPRPSSGSGHLGAVASLEFACREVVPRLRRTSDEIANTLHALDGGYVPAGPSGSPLRGLVNVLPTGRNFYSVDPKAIPSRLAYQTGQAMAESLLQRHLDETGTYPPSVGLSVWGTSAMRTSGDDIGEVLALLGVVPVWDAASRRVTGLEPIPLAELGRPRIDVTVRISGFFRDAFPHVLAMLDDAVRLVADLDEPPEQNFVRAHAHRDLADHGDQRRATTRIFGSKPGAYGAGILPLMEAGNWRNDADLAEVYTAWGGFAYGRDLDGIPARGDMETNYRRIAVAAKNIDTVEHDIADSDDYYQYHGGMVATVRALTGAEPKAYVGDSTSPDAVKTRSLGEETNRIFRARVVNPRWIGAMQRHGYKGAFELAATVDYLYGFDATAGVVTDGMYEQLAESYVLDKQNQDFLKHANPWALRGIIEKLNEAADRGLWAEPDPELMAEMQQVYLDVEGDLEDELASDLRRRSESGPRQARTRGAGVPDRAAPGHADHAARRRVAARGAGRVHLRPRDPARPGDHLRRLGQGPQRGPARAPSRRCARSSGPAGLRCPGRSGWTVTRRRWPTPYAGTPARYRQPRVNPKRVVLVMDVTRILGRP